MTDHATRRLQQKDHEELIIGQFLRQLAASGHVVSGLAYGDAPDATARIDGQSTAIELGCAYADDPLQLWNMPIITGVPNLNFSSSAPAEFGARRLVIDARVDALVHDLQLRLEEKCGHRYGRSYLVLDPSHDELGPQIDVNSVVSRLRVPVDCGFTAIYLAEPAFVNPRRFRIIRDQQSP